ncbi:hypothetical protein MMC12_006734 [Toensbergia leucococca]|nr:hypothetical protein [Toensbergia leucococca]
MRIPSFPFLFQEWRTPITILILFVIEIPFTIAALALFGIASPDLYRNLLWQEGSNHGWNSNPNEILYAYANYRPIKVPLPWSQFVTNYNVVVAVLSTFILLVKSIMYITHTFPPVLSGFVHAILIALFAVSVHNQAASDMSDPLHPQPGAPWYITKGCGAPVKPSLVGYCKQAQGAFAVTCCLLVLFFTYFTLSLFSLIPTKAQRLARASKLSDAESPQSFSMQKWDLPRTPGTSGGMKSPSTPRTLAFDTLGGNVPMRKVNKELPLRHHISMGSETYQGPSRE